MADFTHEYRQGDRAVSARPDSRWANLPAGTEVTITRVDVAAREAHTGRPYNVEVQTPNGVRTVGLGREFDPR